MSSERIMKNSPSLSVQPYELRSADLLFSGHEEMPTEQALLSLQLYSSDQKKKIRKALPQTSLALNTHQLHYSSQGTPDRLVVLLPKTPTLENNSTNYTLGANSIKVTFHLKYLLEYIHRTIPSALVLRTKPTEAPYKFLFCSNSRDAVLQLSELNRRGHLFIVSSNSEFELDLRTAVFDLASSIITNKPTLRMSKRMSSIRTIYELDAEQSVLTEGQPESLPPRCSFLSFPLIPLKQPFPRSPHKSPLRSSRMKVLKSQLYVKKRGPSGIFEIKECATKKSRSTPYLVKMGPAGFRTPKVTRPPQKRLPELATPCIFPMTSKQTPRLKQDTIESRMSSSEFNTMISQYWALKQLSRKKSLATAIRELFSLEAAILSSLELTENSEIRWNSFTEFYIVFIIQRGTFNEIVKFIVDLMVHHRTLDAPISLENILAPFLSVAPLSNKFQETCRNISNSLQRAMATTSFLLLDRSKVPRLLGKSGISLKDLEFFIAELLSHIKLLN